MCNGPPLSFGVWPSFTWAGSDVASERLNCLRATKLPVVDYLANARLGLSPVPILAKRVSSGLRISVQFAVSTAESFP